MLGDHHKGLVINYGEGGLQNGKIAGLKVFAKLFTPPPPLKSGNFFCLPSIWLKLQATA